VSDDDKPRNKGGRPRVPVPGVRVTTFVRTPDYDRLYAIAKRHDRSVSDVVRRAIEAGLHFAGDD
jgi:hypothetical protein